MKKHFLFLLINLIILSNLSVAQEVTRDLNKNIFILVEVTIKPGELVNFMELASKMADDVQANEPGTLNYEWTINKDSTICQIVERYADSDAFLGHMKLFNTKYAEKMKLLGEITDFVLCGNPTEELSQALGESGSNRMTLFTGFAR